VRDGACKLLTLIRECTVRKLQDEYSVLLASKVRVVVVVVVVIEHTNLVVTSSR
jgi:hypothetical protein